MHYLITGGAGFIGSHLAEALLAGGHRVTVLDDLSTGRLANVARIFTFGEIETLAVASVPTRSCAITSLTNNTRIGAWREMAPLLCWLIELTHCGSAGVERCLVGTLLLPLQLASRKAAAVRIRAGTRIRIMEAPKSVDRRSVSTTQDAVDGMQQLWQRNGSVV
jgi:NAD(P)-dependent dehydrogenase (short-subunit alcohol dehydrogenase family)